MAFNINRLVQSECGTPNPLVAAAQQITMKPANALSAARSSVVAGTSSGLVSNSLVTKRASNQLVREFVKFSEQPSISINRTQSTTARTHPQNMTTSTNAPTISSFDQSQRHMAPIASTAAAMNYNSMHNFVMNPQRAFAAEQLETKYRNDMISLTETTQQDINRRKGKTDDDVQFWQSLSQQYMGPNTFDTIAKMQARQRELDQARTKQSSFVDEHQVHEEATKEALAAQLDDVEGTSKWFESIEVSETDYVFDERNPLKNQYEDPFQEGLKRLEQGDIPSAALLFEAAVQKEPENALAWKYLGTTQAQNEKDTSAIKALKNCLQFNPNDQGARLAIAVSLVNETKHHEACQYLLEWLINHDRYKSINASLEQFHEFDNEVAEDPFAINSLATKHYEYVKDKFMAAARMSPNNPDYEVQNSLGVLFNMRGQYDKAVDCFKAALSVRSSDSLLWNRLGATLANGNKSDEAVIAYRRALEISPGFLRSRYNLAISLIHLNLYDEAARQLVQILNMQAAGKGSKHVQIRTRSITSTSIWNTLRTVATLMNKPQLYPIIDGRDLRRCNDELFKGSSAGGLANTDEGAAASANGENTH